MGAAGAGAGAAAALEETEAADFANYFYSYAELDHQKQMLEDDRCFRLSLMYFHGCFFFAIARYVFELSPSVLCSDTAEPGMLLFSSLLFSPGYRLE